LTGVFVDENGQLQREFEFKPYGVALGFTPVVLSEGRISLNISTEVSEPTTEGAFETGGLSSDILGLRIRRANTVVELPAGGSLVIAGLIREESRQSTDGIPGVKDIMWLIKERLMKNSNKTLLNITLLGAALTALTACSTPSASTRPTVFNNPVQVAESIERLELYTRPNGLELSARDQVAVSQFLQSYWAAHLFRQDNIKRPKEARPQLLYLTGL